MNTDAPWPDLDEAEWRVLKIQECEGQWHTSAPTARLRPNSGSRLLTTHVPLRDADRRVHGARRASAFWSAR